MIIYLHSLAKEFDSERGIVIVVLQLEVACFVAEDIHGVLAEFMALEKVYN